MPDGKTRMPAVLRYAADFIDAHPDLPLPFVTEYGVTWCIYSWEVPDVASTVAEIRRAVGGQWDKGFDDATFALTSTVNGFPLKIEAKRDQVCTRRVVGTEQVTVPAVEAQPERTETREVVEWDCAPVLDDRPPTGYDAPVGHFDERAAAEMHQ